MQRRPDSREVTDPSKVAADLRVVLAQLTRRLREQASMGDLTQTQKAVLGRLERGGPATMSALARAEGLRPQSMSAIISALDAAGLVSGAPDPDDGRKTVLSLTDSAREQYASGRLAREDWLFRAIQTELDPNEQGDLASLVALLARLANAR